jgi:hypothetical protein
MKFFAVIFLFGFAVAGEGRGGEIQTATAAPDVLVVADAISIPEGFRPAPGKPVYYVLVGRSQMTLGNSIGGVKLPDAATVERAVVAALASQGFVRTQVGGPVPSICLLVVWGDANFLYQDDEARRDRAKVENLMGTNKPRAQSLSFEAMDKLQAASNEDRLYVLLAALDPTELRKKKKVLLWRTSMSIDWRNNLADALPAMLASAAPFFGTSSDAPAFVDEAGRRKAEVNIGELKVIPNEASPPAGSPVKK